MKALLVLAVALAAPVTLATRYRCVDLGWLYHGASRAMALNDNGMVVGSTGTSDYCTMVWTQQTGMFKPGPLMQLFEDGLCLSVNNSGTVVGRTHWGHRNDFTPFLWRQDRGTKILDRLGRRYATAYGVNSLDQSCGDIATTPVTWDSTGKATVLPQFGGRNWQPIAINDSGTVCGLGVVEPPPYPARAIRLVAGGQPENLGVLPGFSGSRAFAVNNAGTIEGYCESVLLGAQGIMVQPGGQMTPIGPIETECFALNESNQVVGNWYTDVVNAMIIEPSGQMFDLNTVTEDIPQGWRLATATGINERGDISGYAAVGTKIRAFLLVRLD